MYLTLLDIAQGCDYLHNCLNILHGGQGGCAAALVNPAWNAKQQAL